MYKITKDQRDGIVQYLANSNLPAKDAIAIINLLTGLPEISQSKDVGKQRS